jgi:hypothetical protein
MQKFVPEEKKRREKVVILFTRDEADRLNAYAEAKAKQSRYRSELLRRIILKVVEKWETSLQKRANLTSKKG